MKNIFIFKLLTGMWIGLMFAACGEEDITPSIDFPHFYEIKDNPQDPVQHKRYELYTTYNVPVYFNDTIGRIFVKVDRLGDSVFRIEKLDMTWEFTSQDKNTVLEYVYLTDPSGQLNALKVVEEYLAGLSIPLRPFSVLVTKSAVSKTSAAETKVIDRVGFRVVLITGADNLSQAAIKALALKLKKDMITKKMNNYKDQLEAFNKISKDWYDFAWKNLKGVPADFSSSQRTLFGPLDEEELAEIRLVVGKFGFLGGQSDQTISWLGGGTKSPLDKDADLKMFLDEMLKYSKSNFRERWGHAPLVMEKYNILYNVIADKLNVEL